MVERRYPGWEGASVSKFWRRPLRLRCTPLRTNGRGRCGGGGWLDPVLRLRSTPLCSVPLRSGRTEGGGAQGGWWGLAGLPVVVGLRGSFDFDFAALRSERMGGGAAVAEVGLARSFDCAALRCAPFRFAQALRRGSGCSEGGGSSQDSRRGRACPFGLVNPGAPP